MSRLDALSVRENNGKSYFTKIGAAFPNKSGNGFSVLLDAMPAPVDGQFKILLREPQERPVSGGGHSSRAELNDDIPF